MLQLNIQIHKHVPPDLTEGAPLHVLAGQPDVDPLLQQSAESHGLAHRPVHLPLDHHLASGLDKNIYIKPVKIFPIVYLEDPLHGAVDLEVRRVGRTLTEPLADVGQGLLVNSRVRNL